MLLMPRRFHFEIVGEGDPGTLFAVLDLSESSRTEWFAGLRDDLC